MKPLFFTNNRTKSSQTTEKFTESLRRCPASRQLYFVFGITVKAL